MQHQPLIPIRVADRALARLAECKLMADIAVSELALLGVKPQQLNLDDFLFPERVRHRPGTTPRRTWIRNGQLGTGGTEDRKRNLQ